MTMPMGSPPVCSHQTRGDFRGKFAAILANQGQLDVFDRTILPDSCKHLAGPFMVFAGHEVEAAGPEDSVLGRQSEHAQHGRVAVLDAKSRLVTVMASGEDSKMLSSFALLSCRAVSAARRSAISTAIQRSPTGSAPGTIRELYSSTGKVVHGKTAEILVVVETLAGQAFLNVPCNSLAVFRRQTVGDMPARPVRGCRSRKTPDRRG